MLHTGPKSFILFIKLRLKNITFVYIKQKFARRNETITFTQAYYICTDTYTKMKN